MTTDIQKQSIHHNQLIGTLYTLHDTQQKPGILLLSGSDGGIPGNNAIPESFIEYLVKNGFVVFALAYFGIEHLPPHLENIPLEYFQSAIEWLKSLSEVDSSHIGIIGQSRGAELALLLGSHFPHFFQAIIACAPCNMICGGFPYPNRPAWLYQKQPLEPYLPGLSSTDSDLSEADDIKMAIERQQISFHANNAEDPYMIADLFAVREKMLQAKKTQIAVEKIKCPILLMSGDKDAIWPSNLFSEMIMSRLNDHHFQFSKEHISYANAGHGILSSYDEPIYHPVGGFWCKLGGTSEGNKIASEHSWVAIKKFLQKTLYLKGSQQNHIQFRFAPAISSQKMLLHEWLIQPHIAKWIHGVGLQNTLNGLEKFFQGTSTTTYWVGYDKDAPFAFLITSPEGNNAIALDVFICDLNYLGKGIAVPMIREFLITQFPKIEKVLIDPEATNKRAIHVYQKVGFKIVGEFIASWHPVPHYQMELYMKDLLETKK
jgi:dienelactone hydrolase